MVGVGVGNASSGNSEGGVLYGLEFGDGGDGGPCRACIFHNGASDSLEGVGDCFHGFAPFGGDECLRMFVVFLAFSAVFLM